MVKLNDQSNCFLIDSINYFYSSNASRSKDVVMLKRHVF